MRRSNPARSTQRKNPKVSLEYGEDEEFGTKGFRPKGRRDFNYGAGLQVAHDLMEHMDADPTIVGEFKALGAIVYVREGNMERSLASDVLSFFFDVESGKTDRGILDQPGLHAPKCPGRVGLRADAGGWKGWNEEFHESAFMDQIRKYARAEFLYSEDAERAKEFLEFAELALLWMRKGFVLAKRKYDKYGQAHVRRLFTSIQNAVNNEMTGADEGQEYVVDFDLKKGTVYIEPVYEDIPEDE